MRLTMVTADGKLTKKRWVVQHPSGRTIGQFRLKSSAIVRALDEARRIGVTELYHIDVDHKGFAGLFMQSKFYDDGTMSKV